MYSHMLWTEKLLSRKEAPAPKQKTQAQLKFAADDKDKEKVFWRKVKW